MTVIVNEPQQIDRTTWRLTWSSDLVDPTFRIFQDCAFIKTTKGHVQDFTVVAGETLVIEVLDDNSEPSQAYSGRVTMGWYATTDTKKYRIDEWIESAWKQRTFVEETGKGYYKWRSRFLEDVTNHLFRIVPIGLNGNEGTPLEISFFMVRHPDPPNQNFSYSSITNKVTCNA